MSLNETGAENLKFTPEQIESLRFVQFYALQPSL